MRVLMGAGSAAYAGVAGWCSPVCCAIANEDAPTANAAAMASVLIVDSMTSCLDTQE